MKVGFDGDIRLEFHGATDILTQQENLKNLSDINGKWVQKAMKETQHKRIILDMDSSVSPVHGEKEG